MLLNLFVCQIVDLDRGRHSAIQPAIAEGGIYLSKRFGWAEETRIENIGPECVALVVDRETAKPLACVKAYTRIETMIGRVDHLEEWEVRAIFVIQDLRVLLVRIIYESKNRKFYKSIRLFCNRALSF